MSSNTIATAARLLRENAEELKQAHTLAGLGEWPACEGEVRTIYDEYIAVATALEAMPSQCLHQIQEPQQPVAEICSASQDDAEFGERAIFPLRDLGTFEYGTKLYAAPAAVAVPDVLTLPLQVGNRYVRRDGKMAKAIEASPEYKTQGLVCLVATGNSQDWALVSAETGRWRADVEDSQDAVSDALAATPAAAAPVVLPEPDAQAQRAEGIKQVAKMLQKRADAYSDQHLSTDPYTGATEGSEAHIEYWNWLLELVDDVLALLAGVSAPAAQREPVAWLYTHKLGGVQAFTTEPPPGLKAQCQPLYTAPQTQADARDAELLDFLHDQCIDLRCFTTSDGEDVGWRTVQHHMGEPRERVASEVYSDAPRQAIREAMARIERDPYCTGPLHAEDDAAIAAAKGEQL